jgi:hypothetical protein
MASPPAENRRTEILRTSGMLVGALLMLIVAGIVVQSIVNPVASLAFVEQSPIKVLMAALIVILVARFGWAVFQFCYLPSGRRWLSGVAMFLIAGCLAASQSPAIILAVARASVSLKANDTVSQLQKAPTETPPDAPTSTPTLLDANASVDWGDSNYGQWQTVTTIVCLLFAIYVFAQSTYWYIPLCRETETL